jgi:hypothetical protein
MQVDLSMDSSLDGIPGTWTGARARANSASEVNPEPSTLNLVNPKPYRGTSLISKRPPPQHHPRTPVGGRVGNPKP